MARPKSQRAQEIRRFILHGVTDHPRDLVRAVATHFGITRQAAARHVNELVGAGQLSARGATRQRSYGLPVLAEKVVTLSVDGMEEDVVWRDHVAKALSDLEENVVDMWHYGFTEIVNNVIDHSGGKAMTIELKRNAAVTNIAVFDDGIGIFRKIADAYHLEDDRHAVLELAKGKLTTDPDHHTGEGIFFTSRIMTEFQVLSGDVYFSHHGGEDEDWILEVERPVRGTAVFMGLDNFSSGTTKEVFDHFASDAEDYGFTKTVVPVRLVRQGAEKVVSRSQAKRLLSRLDKFRTVILDFEGVESIGRAFADEIFRVFVQAHPGILVMHVRTNPEIARLIEATRTQGSQATASPEQNTQ